jgi:hypothetical protein
MILNAPKGSMTESITEENECTAQHFVMQLPWL